jgi:peptidoglycan hydrolase-like protein with peptidoglycan-binding domain
MATLSPLLRQSFLNVHLSDDARELMNVRSATVSAPSLSLTRAAPPRFDGSTPAPGTTNTRASQVTNPPLQGDPKNRNADTYNQVINQFAVGENKRYTPRDSSGDGVKDTFCNIFLWDVTRAMGAEIPHWVDNKGNAVAPGKGWEMNANATVDWMHKHGGSNGWRKVTADEAQKMANAGHPSVALWKNPGGIGHVGVVRPGEVTSQGPSMAQAGGKNFNNKHVKDGFGNRPVEYWVNDSGKATGKPATEPTKPPPSTKPLPPTSSTGVSVPKTDMKRGVEGPEVLKLQKALIQLGYMTQAQVNTGPGIFGPMTEKAVAKFQKDQGISPNSGIFGPKTRAAMTKALGGQGGTQRPGTTGPVTGPTKPTGSDATKAANIDKILKGTGLAPGRPHRGDVEEVQRASGIGAGHVPQGSVLHDGRLGREEQQPGQPAFRGVGEAVRRRAQWQLRALPRREERRGGLLPAARRPRVPRFHRPRRLPGPHQQVRAAVRERQRAVPPASAPVDEAVQDPGRLSHGYVR